MGGVVFIFINTPLLDINYICNILTPVLSRESLRTDTVVFYFQGDMGLPGFPGPTGMPGAGIQGEKVGKISSSIFSQFPELVGNSAL